MKRILVCEDEDAIRDFVVINLVRSGYDVVDVSCGEDALAQFPEAVTTIFGKSPVVIATLLAVFLNLVLPREEK